MRRAAEDVRYGRRLNSCPGLLVRHRLPASPPLGQRTWAHPYRQRWIFPTPCCLAPMTGQQPGDTLEADVTIVDVDLDLLEISEARRVLHVDGWDDPEVSQRVNDLLDARLALMLVTA